MKRIFLHHIDGFENNAIKNSLMTQNIENSYSLYEIFASVNQMQNNSKVMHVRHPLEILYPSYGNYIQRIISCDVMIFNTGSDDFETVCIDLHQVLKALEDWANEQKKKKDTASDPKSKKYLILISSPMTWALSKSDIPDNEEETEECTDCLYEDDYRRRKAHKCYCKHKFLERDVIWLQKKTRDFVKTLVVCPGITYGGENDKFHYIFKLAFYNKIVPVLKPGSQLIPMIYIKDFVQIMKNIITEFPESKVRYIFAAQPKFMSLKYFTCKICKTFNGDCSKVRFYRNVELLMFDRELFPQTVLDVLTLNIKLSLTYLRDFPFQEMTEEFWEELTDEFRNERNVHPIKLVLDGPPLVGKTELSRKLSEHYQIPFIHTRNGIAIYIDFLENKINDSINYIETFECPEQLDTEEGEQEDMKDVTLVIDKEDEDTISELKAKIDMWSKELFKLKVYIASHKTFLDQGFEAISRCLIALIRNNQFNLNQGYVMDGFPFTYDQAQHIFFNTRNISNDDLANNEPPLKPTHFIMLDATDELLCKRAMGFSEIEAITRRCLRHEMLPRLDRYRNRNEEPSCLANVFYDNDMVPIHIFIEPNTAEVDTFRAIQAEIGPPFIYPLSIAQQEALKRQRAAELLKYEEEQRLRKEELAKSVTLERERKLLDWTVKYEELQKHENELREAKTLPLRQYLGKYVLPTLTEGILKVSELKPDDPIDFLAEYLFKHNPEGQQMPPFCTDDQMNRFFGAFYENVANTSEYELTKDKFGCSECPDRKSSDK